MESQLKSALSMGKAATVGKTAKQFATAVASIVPKGFFPTAPVPVPLSPSGKSAGEAQIKAALSMGKGAQVAMVAQMIAVGVSLIAPVAPSSGLSGLSAQLKSALSMGKAAKPAKFAKQAAAAIIAYYQAGGVI